MADARGCSLRCSLGSAVQLWYRLAARGDDRHLVSPTDAMGRISEAVIIRYMVCPLSREAALREEPCVQG